MYVLIAGDDEAFSVSNKRVNSSVPQGSHSLLHSGRYQIVSSFMGALVLLSHAFIRSGLSKKKPPCGNTVT